MTTITDLCRAYQHGGLSWPSLRDQLVTRSYPTPKRDRGPRPTTAAALENHVDGSTFGDPGTWDEVRRARNFGLLTNDQYLEIANAIADRKTARSAGALHLDAQQTLQLETDA